MLQQPKTTNTTMLYIYIHLPVLLLPLPPSIHKGPQVLLPKHSLPNLSIRNTKLGSTLLHILRLVYTSLQGKNNVCFGKGHPQLMRTVRLAEDGVRYQLVSSGEIMTMAVDGHFYYRIKPGSVSERGPPSYEYKRTTPLIGVNLDR